MPDNAKLIFDRSRGRQEPESDPDSAPTSAPLADTEAQMRRALGLNGGNLFRQKPKQEQERPERQDSQSSRPSQDRFGAAPRRRFVQDGDVPVTVLRREQQFDLAAARAAAVGPSPEVLKLQDDLGQERANREKSEKALADAQATIRDLRNKLGFADLARTEAEEQARKMREAAVTARQTINDLTEARRELEERTRIAERERTAAEDALDEERTARKQAEKALKASEDARAEAERLVRVLSAEAEAAPAAVVRKAAPAPRRPRVVEDPTPTEGPEPVKWWLSAPGGKKR